MTTEQASLPAIMWEALEANKLNEVTIIPHPLYPERTITVKDTGPTGQSRSGYKMFFTDPLMAETLQAYEASKLDAEAIRASLKSERDITEFQGYLDTLAAEGEPFKGFVISEVQLQESILKRWERRGNEEVGVAGQLKVTVIAETLDGRLKLKSPIYALNPKDGKTPKPVKGLRALGAQFR